MVKTSDLVKPGSQARWDKTVANGDRACEVCGRPVAPDCSTFLVEHCATGELVPAIAPAPDSQSYNCRPVGPECAKRKDVAPYVHKA